MSASVAARISLDSSQFEAGLQRCSSMMTSFAGLVGIGGFSALAHDALEAGEQIHATSVRLGISTDAVQHLSLAARESGTSIEATTKAMTKLIVSSRNLGDEKLSAFGRLGIDVDELKTLNPEQLLEEIAEGFKDAKDPGQALADVIKLMGRGAGELVPLLAGGREALKQMFDQPVMSQESIDQLKEAHDVLERLKNRAVVAAGTTVSFLSEVTQHPIEFTKTIVGGAMADFADHFGRHEDAENIRQKLFDSVVSKTPVKAPPRLTGGVLDLDEEEEKAKKAKAKTGPTSLDRLGRFQLDADEAQQAIKEKDDRDKAKSDKDELRNSHVTGLHADSLSQIGLFAGGRASSTNVIATVAQHTKSTAEHLAAIRMTGLKVMPVFG